MEPDILDVRASKILRYGYLVAAAVTLIPILVLVISHGGHPGKKLSDVIILGGVIVAFLALHWFFSVSFSYYPRNKIVVRRPFLREKEYRLGDLSGWTMNASSKSRSVLLLFNDGKKLALPFIGDEIEALAAKIVADNFEGETISLK